MELVETHPEKLLADKSYDTDAIRDDLKARDVEPVIPPKSNRVEPIEYDRETYKRRNRIERCVNALKQFLRIATRYEKTARAFLSAMHRSRKALDQNCQHGLVAFLAEADESRVGVFDLGLAAIASGNLFSVPE